MELPIYLDYHATTPVDPRVLDAMLPFFCKDFGNSHSTTHAFGWRAEQAIENAREQVAEYLGASSPSEIIFTSGATESNNLALSGIARAHTHRGKHIISSSIEHKSVLDCLRELESEGFAVSLVPVDEYGQVNVGAIREAIRPDTILISVMAANNEVGTINPIRAIAALAKEKEIYLHTDAVQAIGKFPLSMEQDGIDLLSLSGHKIYGPKGVGALYVRRKNPHITLQPILFGGGHERGLRSGTLNTPGIVGLGKALELLGREYCEESERVRQLRDRLQECIQAEIPDIIINGHPEERVYNNLNISVPYIAGETLLASLRDLAVSSGSACSSDSREGSHVLLALGHTLDLAKASIRFGLGRFTTREEVDFAAKKVYTTIKKLQQHSPLYQLRKEQAAKEE